MKLFLAYRFTGEKKEDLEKILVTVRDSLQKNGVEVYCSFFDQETFASKKSSARDIMDHAFSVLDKSDMLFVLQTSENKSEGLLMEVGYAIAKNIPIAVAIKEGVKNTYLPEMAGSVIRWKNLQDLVKQVESLKLI